MKTKLLLALLLAPALSWGAINPVPVQTASNEANNTTSLAIGSGQGWSTPTSGNILTCQVGVRGNTVADDNTVTLTGYTLVESAFDTNDGSGQLGAGFWFKVSAGTESTVSFTIANAQDYWTVACQEWASTDLAGTVDVSVDDDTNVQTPVTSQPTGTTAATSVADSLAISLVVSSRLAGWNPATVPGAYTQRHQWGGANFRPAGWLATEVLTATGTQSETWTTTAGGEVAWAAIVVFEGVAGTSVTFDQDTYNPGDTINATATGYGSAMTTATEGAGGDVINAEAGATASDADFILCGAGGFETAGACNNTQLEKLLTYTVAPGNATDTLTINVPANDSFGQMDCDPDTGCDADSIFKDLAAGYDIGDEYWCEVTAGTCTCSDGGVVECTAVPANITLRAFDVSTGAWGAAVPVNITSPTTDDCLEVGSSLSWLLGGSIGKSLSCKICVSCTE